jgi:hypothetical protein
MTVALELERVLLFNFGFNKVEAVHQLSELLAMWHWQPKPGNNPCGRSTRPQPVRPAPSSSDSVADLHSPNGPSPSN